MVHRAVAHRPLDVTRAFQNIHESNEVEVCLTLRIYKPLEEDVTTHEESDAHPLGRRLLEPLYHDWALALRDIELPPEGAKLEGTIILDVTRPSTDIMNLMQYEARGLARLAALLRHKFRKMASLQMAIEGAPCWCILYECEKHTAALPKAPSWPISRTSHDAVRGTRPRGISRCLKLASEHWEDEYWTMSEKH